MRSVLLRMCRRGRTAWYKGRCWIFLRRRVTGRIKLRGDCTRIDIDPSFRCDGDLWLGVHADQGRITIEAGVSASGPLIVTAVRPLTIGAGALFGPNVLITDHYHGDPRDAAQRRLTPSARPLHSPGGITICENVQLGANAVVLAPATIGPGAIIGANAVVKGDVPALAIHTGVASSATRRLAVTTRT